MRIGGARIGGVGAFLGISGAWIKLQEKLGKIPPVRRDKNGHRRFDEDDIQRLQRLLYGDDEVKAWARRQGLLDDAEGAR